MNKEFVESNCLNFEYILLKNFYFDDRKETDDYLLCYSNVIDDYFWNMAYLKNKFNKEKLDILEAEFRSLNSKSSSIYIGKNDNDYADNKRLLLENNYKLNDTDVYMAFDRDVPIDINLDIKIVENEEEYNDYMKVLASAYNDSIENPDENVYADCITEGYYNAIRNTIGDNTHFHIVAYDNEVPVSVATLSFVDGIAGINNVGTVQGHWNKGYGKQVIKYAIDKFKELGGDILTLSTEYQSKNQRFYEKLGFKEIFVMEQYMK